MSEYDKVVVADIKARWEKACKQLPDSFFKYYNNLEMESE